jgi:hypothetical protein
MFGRIAVADPTDFQSGAMIGGNDDQSDGMPMPMPWS